MAVSKNTSNESIASSILIEHDTSGEKTVRDFKRLAAGLTVAMAIVAVLFALLFFWLKDLGPTPESLAGYFGGVIGAAAAIAGALVAIRLAVLSLNISKNTADMQALSNERERVRYEFDLKRDITEQFGPLMQSNLQIGAALNALLVESVRLNRAVSKEVERVMFDQRVGIITLTEPEHCQAIARHVKSEAFESVLQNVKGALHQLYEALSVANGNPLARLAVAKQLEINTQSSAGRALLDLFSSGLPKQAVAALAPVDFANFAEHIRVKAQGVTPALRLVECWAQASLYGALQHDSWLPFTSKGDAVFRLDSSGEKEGIPAFKTVVKKLLRRNESIGEGLFFLGSLIALHTENVELSENLLSGSNDNTWRVNLGVLALVDFYNAIPSKEALKLAAHEIYGDDQSMNADMTHPNQLYAAIIERLPYEHDSPSMRLDKDLDSIRSVLPKVYSRIIVSLDQDMRTGNGEFFNLCVGPRFDTPAYIQYIKATSIANIRTIEVALKIQAQTDVHFRDFHAYLKQEMYERAHISLNYMLGEMVILLAYYNPDVHSYLYEKLSQMYIDVTNYLQTAAKNKKLESSICEKFIGLLRASISSVQKNEGMDPESRIMTAQWLHEVIGRIEVAIVGSKTD